MNHKRFVAWNKTRFERGYSYVGALGIGFVVASALQEHLFRTTPLWLLYPAGILVTWLIGFIDMRFGYYSEAVKWQTMENPHFKEMLEMMRRDKR